MTITPAVGHVRLLEMADLNALRALANRDRLVNLFVRQRLEQGSQSGLGRSWLGTQWWGYFEGGRLVSACHVGANIVPIEGTERAARAFGIRLARREPRSGSLVGPADPILQMWADIEPSWGTARSFRPYQPFMVLDHDSRLPIDPDVRLLTPREFSLVRPAAFAMFTEEVGLDPDPHGTGIYDSRIRHLLSAGHTVGIVADTDSGPCVMFKADVGIHVDDVVQLQGVWLHPSWRGQGRAASAIAASVHLIRRHVAPIVTLYVNDYNVAARRSYERVGFIEQSRFATVMT